MPETGEERYSSFCGVPIQRLGEMLGVLVVQSKAAREFTPDEVYALEVVAMVIAEMTELGAFVGEGAALSARHQQPVLFRGIDRAGRGQRRAMSGCTNRAWWSPTRSPMIPTPNCERLREAVEELRVGVDNMLVRRTVGRRRTDAGA